MAGMVIRKRPGCVVHDPSLSGLPLAPLLYVGGCPSWLLSSLVNVSQTHLCLGASPGQVRQTWAL